MKLYLHKPGAKQVPNSLSSYTTLLVDFLEKRLDIPKKVSLLINLRPQSMYKNNEASIYHVEKNLYCMDVCLYANWVMSICHEMVHLKQFATGELSSDLRCWKGKKITADSYWDLPYEKEAYKLQHTLVEEFEKWTNHP